MPEQFEVPQYIEWVAAFTWALSGAIVGVKREFDEVGVFVIAVVSSFGGGIIRDGLFLQRPPVVATNQNFLIIITVAVLLVLVLGRFIIRLPYLEKIIGLIDAIGTPAFCIVGLQLALGYGYPIIGVLLLGVISGIGGGILRDVMTARVPAVLQPGQFSTLLVLLACLLFLGLKYVLQLPAGEAGWITVAAFFVARIITIRFNWRTVPVAESPLWQHLGRR